MSTRQGYLQKCRLRVLPAGYRRAITLLDRVLNSFRRRKCGTVTRQDVTHPEAIDLGAVLVLEVGLPNSERDVVACFCQRRK